MKKSVFGIISLANGKYAPLSDIDAAQIKAAYLLGGMLAVTFEPPADCFGKAADCVVKAVLLGDVAAARQLTFKDAVQVLLEIPHKDLAALPRKQTVYALLLFLQVIEDMCQIVAEAVMLGKIVLFLTEYIL